MDARPRTFVSPGQFSAGYDFEDDFSSESTGNLVGQNGWSAYLSIDSLIVAASARLAFAPLTTQAAQRSTAGLNVQQPWRIELDVDQYHVQQELIIALGDSPHCPEVILDQNDATHSALIIGTIDGLNDHFTTFLTPTAPFTLIFAWDGTTLSATIGVNTVTWTPGFAWDVDLRLLLYQLNNSLTLPAGVTAIRAHQPP